MKHLYAWFALLLLWHTAAAYAVSDNGKLPIIRLQTEKLSPLQTGLALGAQAKQRFPDIERRYDTWLAELFSASRFDMIRQQQLPALLKQMEASRLDEIQGVSGAWQLTRESHPGDGKLSLEEYQILNLLPDLGMAPDGIGLGAFGQVSADNHPIVGHNLEWRNGSSIRHLQVITAYIGKDAAFVTIGAAGLISALQGFNQQGVFAALLNAEPYSPYSLNRPTPSGKQTLLSFSVRRILESSSSIPAASKRLDDEQYAFAHSILLADANSVQVQEYAPPQRRFRPRYWDSPLHGGMHWEHPQQIAAVDCLMLSTMPDTCHDAKDSVRWQRLDTLLHFSAQQPATANDISSILFDTANKRYELFTEDTLQSLYFLPANNSLYLYTAPTGTHSDDNLIHQAYLDLLPRTPPWELKLKWFIWPLILLMLSAVVWVSRRKSEQNLL